MQWARDLFLLASLVMCFIADICSTAVLSNKIGCRFQQTDALQCAREHGVFQIPDESASYGFGFGSVDDVEIMCKKKWHILVQACVGERVLRRCREQGASEFQLSMWRFIFDPRPHEKAAFYLCHTHNLNIFRTHRDSCLKLHEVAAQTCAKRQIKELAKYTTNMAARTEEDASQDSTSSADYASFIKRKLSNAYCETTLEKIECLTNLLQPNCSLDVVHLIQNYFRELLPPGCHYFSTFQTEDTNNNKTVQVVNSNVKKPHQGQRLDDPSSSSFLLNDANNQDDGGDGGIGGSFTGNLRGWRNNEARLKPRGDKESSSSQTLTYMTLIPLLVQCISLVITLL